MYLCHECEGLPKQVPRFPTGVLFGWVMFSVAVHVSVIGVIMISHCLSPMMRFRVDCSQEMLGC